MLRRSTAVPQRNILIYVATRRHTLQRGTAPMAAAGAERHGGPQRARASPASAAARTAARTRRGRHARRASVATCRAALQCAAQRCHVARCNAVRCNVVRCSVATCRGKLQRTPCGETSACGRALRRHWGMLGYSRGTALGWSTSGTCNPARSRRSYPPTQVTAHRQARPVGPLLRCARARSCAPVAHVHISVRVRARIVECGIHVFSSTQFARVKGPWACMGYSGYQPSTVTHCSLRIRTYIASHLGLVSAVRARADAVLALDCHPKKELLATGAMEQDKTIKLWALAL
jgi:hypothetical protein